MKSMKTLIYATILILLTSVTLYAYDTDVYKVNVKPNVAIMFDTSGSMDFGVYEATVDYGAFYNERAEAGDCDMIAGGCGTSAYFYASGGAGTGRQYRKDEILLVKGNIGVSVTADNRTFTGDPGDPNYLWYIFNVVQTYTCIDSTGNLFNCEGGTQRITTDADENILLDGQALPLDRGIKLHDFQENMDGSLTDKGFGGMLNAPGWHFSGYEGVNLGSLDVVENGDTNVYFFIPGNWINMQMMYNLYTQYTTDEAYRTWKTTTFSNSPRYIVQTDIHTQNYPGNYPQNSDYTFPAIIQSDADNIQLCFKDFRTEYNKDPLKIYSEIIKTPNLEETLSGNLGSNFCVGPYTLGPTKNLLLHFSSDNKPSVYKGFKIDKYTYARSDEVGIGYKMQRRIDVVRDAILYTIEITRGQINWALLSFSVSPTGDGAKIWQPFNPTLNDDAVRQSIVTHLNQFTPDGGTPLGEALQDTWNHFVDKANNAISECSNNFAITISDGYPSADTDWSRADFKTGAFTDEDGDGWTSDPYQPPVYPNYLDDVSRFMYTHSIRDGSSIAEANATSSYDNVINHMLSFMMGSLLMEDAAIEGGGEYLTAFNKQQVVNALVSLALSVIKSTSYVAPVVSVDKSNKTQHGDELYMAFFKPKNDRWTGNLKKYGLAKINSSCPDRNEEEWTIIDSAGSVATDCDGMFKLTSVSYWSSESDGGEVEAGGVGEVLKNRLNSINLSNQFDFNYRKIYLIQDDGTKVEFIPSNITNAMLDVDTDEERYKVMNYVWGFSYETSSNTTTPIGVREWPLGSFIHSSPKVLQYESTNATSKIAIGSNDGMLHVFDNDTGVELVAYIFEPYLDQLKTLHDAVTYPNPLYFLDGPISLYSTYDTAGKTTPLKLYIGERRGGKHYYVLDVSSPDPTQWSQSTVLSTGTTGLSELGETWSEIQFGKLSVGSGSQTVGVFTGGYDPNQDNSNPGTDSMGRAIYIIDVATDNVMYSFDASTYSSMEYSFPADPTLVPDLNGKLYKILAVDAAAQIWQLTYGDSVTEWGSGPEKVFTSNSNSNDGRKMFYGPAVTILGDCGYGDNITSPDSDIGYYSYMVFVGTGDREKPSDTDIDDRLYGVIIEDGVTLDESDLFDITTVDGFEPENTDKRGFYLRLNGQTGSHSGEKCLASPSIYYEISYFTTYMPIGTDPCAPHGEGFAYALDYCNGQAAIDYDGDGDIDINDRSMSLGESIPSGLTIIFRDGLTAGFISAGGAVPGAGIAGSTRIPQPSNNFTINNWHELINQTVDTMTTLNPTH